VVQRVKDARVSVDGVVRGQISGGLLVYLGVARGDCREEAQWLAEKISGLRLFDDQKGVMNLSIREYLEGNHIEGGGILAVSQFTLLGDARKGRRPSWNRAADPAEARPLYEYFVEKVRETGLPCETGVFQAHMELTYTNDGPVTLLLDTKE